MLYLHPKYLRAVREGLKTEIKEYLKYLLEGLMLLVDTPTYRLTVLSRVWTSQQNLLYGTAFLFSRWNSNTGMSYFTLDPHDQDQIEFLRI